MLSPQAQEIRTFMERTAASSIVQAHLPVETRRAQFEAQRALIPLPPDVKVEAITAGSVAAEWVNILDLDKHQVVLYVHGGGFVWGSCTSSRLVAATFARVAQARVLVLDYRLAPEHPYPAAPQDCLAAYHWLLDSGVSPEHLVIVGDSAGGGLVLALLVKLAQEALPQPAGAVLISPWLDLTLSGGSYTRNTQADFMESRELLLEMCQSYLGAHDPRSPLVSPLFAEVSGLPPLLVYAGSDELLVDDAIRLAERLRRVGGSVELQIGEGFWHTWPITATMRPFPDGTQALERIGAFVRSHHTC